MRINEDGGKAANYSKLKTELKLSVSLPHKGQFQKINDVFNELSQSKYSV